MQHPTAHHPITTDDLPWQEQLLIRLDEVVGLLDSINTRLDHLVEGTGGFNVQVSDCQGQPIPDTRHTDVPSPLYVACPLAPVFQPLSPYAEEQPQ